jgi:hypothetical protein
MLEEKEEKSVCLSCEYIGDFPACIGNEVTTIRKEGKKVIPTQDNIFSCDNYREHLNEEYPHAE